MRELYTQARQAFERVGFIPYLLAMELQGLGVNVGALEMEWGIDRDLGKIIGAADEENG